MRIGIGYDLHRLEPGRPLILGGQAIPFERGLQGHSDADVLTHAVIDALLGAAALGNIGALFPDTDPRYKDADSQKLLQEVVRHLEENGWRIVNIDTNIVAQRPRLNPHIDSIRRRLAQCLGIALECVSVKAKTNEEVGPEGREEAMSAQAVALIERRSA